MMMKAAVVRAHRDIRIETVDMPPVRDDEVLVKAMACGICGTDVHAFKNLTLRGSGGQRWDLAMDFVSSGRVRMGDMVTHRFPLDGVREGFETQLDAGKSIKVVILPQSGKGRI
jgi:threonine dehydrogenase-like Zn-dependent dehydrogenase